MKKDLSDMINDKILGISRYYYREFEGSIEKCESPIEKLLALELKFLADVYNDTFGRVIIKKNPFYTVYINIATQVEIKANNHNYRADILISSIDVISNTKNMVVVECDGHEFHEKTKEQVKKNNERDRDLMHLGYTVIHFSGSEIYGNVRKCAEDALGIAITPFVKQRSEVIE